MIHLVNKILKEKRINLITILCLIFVSLLSLFPAGALHPSTLVEKTAQYLANVAEKHTVNGVYTGLVIEPKDNSDKKVNNPYNEFHYLYGLFREGLATYVGSGNADKSHVVRIKELDDDSNFSFLNVDTGFGVKKYYIDKDGNQVYKQEFYPLELMFYSSHPPVKGATSFIYISKSKADILLDKKSLEHTRQNYKSLLNSLITLDFDGHEYQFAIDNIYLEQNYFYEALDEVMGDFLLGGVYPNSILKKQALFFLRNYTFQNKFYIEHATSLYPLSDFDYLILNRNFKDNFEIDNSKLIYVSSSNNTSSIVLLVFSILLLITSLALILFGTYEETLINHAFVVGSLLIPYLIFWIINLITKNVILFSSFSIISTIWCVLGFVLLYFVIYLYKRTKKSKKESK